MLAINIQGPCTASHASCWSKQHRCFVACQDHVITRATYLCFRQLPAGVRMVHAAGVWFGEAPAVQPLG